MTVGPPENQPHPSHLAEHQNAPSEEENVNVEDMEIAWENLEAARNIVSALIAQDEGHVPHDYQKKLRLDLAQILLREGDVSTIQTTTQL